MASFSWLDYAIFASYLAVTVLIGLWFTKGQETLSEYFLAGQHVNRFVVAMTVLAALFSGISYLAGPAEVYTSGFGFAWISFSFFIATPFTALYVLPHLYKKGYFTAYQYLEERFSLGVRLLASGLFILRVLLWLAAATYAPALALKEVTQLPLWFTIVCTGLVTTIYTMFGGMKAVIWTDVMQLVVLFGGQLLIMVIAVANVPGGLAGVWATNLQDSRLAISLSLDPQVRITLWGVLIGGAFLSLVQMATDQVSVQRYLTAGSLREAQRSLWIKLWLLLPVLLVFYGSGLVLYAFYKVHGDPLAAGQIARSDQILPYFVVTQLPKGLPAVLIAAIFSASMSTVSAGINSLTSATICDFLQTFRKRSGAEGERALLGLARGFTLLYGLLVTGLAFAIAAMKSNLVESVNTVIAVVGGPLLGLFLLGMSTRAVGSLAAVGGGLIGFSAATFCTFYRTPGGKPLVSFLWITMVGTLVTMLLGLALSRILPQRSKSV